jgi:hypothetical protein
LNFLATWEKPASNALLYVCILRLASVFLMVGG